MTGLPRPLRVEPEAADELAAAAARYELESPGLGLALIAAVREEFSRLQQFPRVGTLVPKIPKKLSVRRRLLTRRFPFGIVYMDLDPELVVIAIAHTSRKPGYWRSRYRRYRR